MTHRIQSDFPGQASTIEEHAADVRAPAVGEGSQVTYTYPIRQPEEDFNDFQVGIRASVLRRCRRRLENLVRNTFPTEEVLLAVSMLAAGGSLSAIVAEVALASWRGVVFFIALPLISVGCGVAYGMLRHFTLRTVKQVSEDILDDLSNPDQTVDVTKR
jgi:hypothetical protein